MEASSSPVGQAQRSNSRKLVISLVVLLVGAAATIAVLTSKYFSSTATIEAHVQTILLQAQQMEALDRLAVRVEKFNREFGASVGRLQLNENLQTNVKDLEQKQNLSDAAKKTLEEFEQNVAAIAEMTAKVKEYERYLGSPATVKSGDTHVAIARRYLLEEAKLPAVEAEAIIRRTALAWELEPGNQVFNLYHEGMLLSTVTQGTAKRAPLMVQLAKRQSAAARVVELEEKVRDLESKLTVASGSAEATEAAPTPSPAPAADPAATPK